MTDAPVPASEVLKATRVSGVPPLSAVPPAGAVSAGASTAAPSVSAMFSLSVMAAVSAALEAVANYTGEFLEPVTPRSRITMAQQAARGRSTRPQ